VGTALVPYTQTNGYGGRYFVVSPGARMNGVTIMQHRGKACRVHQSPPPPKLITSVVRVFLPTGLLISGSGDS